MSDTPDPYAARPYVPPTDRLDDEPGDAAPADAPAGQPEGAAGSDPFTHRFEPTAPAQDAQRDAPDAATSEATPSSGRTSDPDPQSGKVPTAATYAADPNPAST